MYQEAANFASTDSAISDRNGILNSRFGHAQTTNFGGGYKSLMSLSQQIDQQAQADSEKARLYQQAITRATIRNFGLSSVSDVDELARTMARPVVRGQVVDPSDPKSRLKWETASESFFNYALFPTVFTYKPQKVVVGSKETIRSGDLLTYAVIYTSFPLGQDSEFVGGDPTKHLCPFKPNYRTVNVVGDKQFTFGAGYSPQFEIYVDNTLLGDKSAVLSLVSSINNSFIQPNSFITFIPLPDPSVDTAAFNDALRSPSKYRIRGPSMGLATFAAISGWMPWYYTGYIKYVLPEGVLMRDYAAKREFYEKNPGAFQGVPEDDVFHYGPDGKPMNEVGKVVKQWSFVEPIGALLWKFLYCSRSNAPFLFPATSDMAKDTFSYLLSADVSNRMINYYGIMPSIYNMAMALDGVPMIRASGNNTFVMTSCAGHTLSDFMCLNNLLTYNILKAEEYSNQVRPTDLITMLKIESTAKTQAARYARRMGAIVDDRREDRAEIKRMIALKKSTKDILAHKKSKKAAREKKRKDEQKQRAAKYTGTLKQMKQVIKDSIKKMKDALEQNMINLDYYHLSKAEKRQFKKDYAYPTKQQISDFLKKFGIKEWNFIIPHFTTFLPRGSGANGYALLVRRIEKLLALAMKPTNEQGLGIPNQDEAWKFLEKFFGYTKNKYQRFKQLAAIKQGGAATQSSGGGGTAPAAQSGTAPPAQSGTAPPAQNGAAPPAQSGPAPQQNNPPPIQQPRFKQTIRRLGGRRNRETDEINQNQQDLSQQNQGVNDQGGNAPAQQMRNSSPEGGNLPPGLDDLFSDL